MLLYMFFIFLFSNVANADYYEGLLLRDLSNGYNTLERPVATHNEPVIVHLDFELQQIVDLNEKLQAIETIACLKYRWIDQNMKWNPAEYGNIQDLRMPIGKIWKPDVLLYNSVDAGFEKTFAVNAKLRYDGTVSWEPPAVMKTSCKIDVTFFPFDDQLCHFKFGSWTYNGAKLDLQIGERGLDTRRYIENGEWLLLEAYENRTTEFLACCPNEPYYDIKFYLRLRRRTLFYGFNLIIPSLLVSMMALLAFTLPPDSGEKIALELTVLLSLCYCLQMVADMTPPTSEAVPLLGLFFVCCIFLISCSSVLCVLVLNLHHADPDTQLPMPRLVALVLIKWLPVLLIMSRPKREGRRKVYRRESKQNTKRSSKFIDDESECQTRHETCSDETTLNGRNELIMGKMMDMLKDKTKMVSKVFRKSEDASHFKNDWKYAATVVDRLCLIIFSTMIVSFTCSIFFSADYVAA